MIRLLRGGSVTNGATPSLVGLASLLCQEALLDEGLQDSSVKRLLYIVVLLSKVDELN